MNARRKAEFAVPALARPNNRGVLRTCASSVLTRGCGPLFVACVWLFLGHLTLRACCTNPTSETTRNVGEDPTYPYATDFDQTINENLEGKTVTEAAGKVGSDRCYFSGSAVNPVVTISGGSWTILGQTVWGPDVVGWKKTSGGTEPVPYYRQHKRYPCGFTIYQRLKVNCNPTYYVRLPGNKLVGWIDSATQVTNCRYEQIDQSSACQTLNK
jgi:hypothetical protein